jgi:hypothetical protein
MSLRHSILLSVALVSLLGGSAGLAASPAREAQRAFKQARRVAERDARDCFKIALREFKNRLREIRSAVESGELSAAQALAETSAAAAWYAAHLDLHSAYVSAALSATGTALLGELDSVPFGFRAGDGGTWDQFVNTLNGLYLAFGQKGAGKLEQLVDLLREFLNGGGEIQLEITIRIVIVLPPLPAPPGPVPPPPPGVKITSLSSAHDSRINNDGKLSVRGTGPRNGVVQVNIQGPNGVNITQNVPTDGDGNFQAGFPSLPGDGNPGNLPEGNYQVTVSSGGQSASQFHGV